MKKILAIFGGIIFIGVLILGYQIYSDLNRLKVAFQREHKLTDPSLVILDQKISPDQKFQFFMYNFDTGAFGYSRVFWSVLKNDSTIISLEKGILPDGYKALGWTEGNELILEKWEPYYYKSEEVELADTNTFNGVSLKLITRIDSVKVYYSTDNFTTPIPISCGLLNHYVPDLIDSVIIKDQLFLTHLEVRLSNLKPVNDSLRQLRPYLDTRFEIEINHQDATDGFLCFDKAGDIRLDGITMEDNQPLRNLIFSKLPGL